MSATQFRRVNGHISAASNSALQLATGEFVALADHDDVLPAHALLAVVHELNRHPDADIAHRAVQAMLRMRRIDLAALEAAVADTAVGDG